MSLLKVTPGIQWLVRFLSPGAHPNCQEIVFSPPRSRAAAGPGLVGVKLDDAGGGRAAPGGGDAEVTAAGHENRPGATQRQDGGVLRGDDSRKFNLNRLGMGGRKKTGQVVGKGKMHLALVEIISEAPCKH